MGVVETGIQTSTDARFYTISSKFLEPYTNQGKDLVLQFSVKHEQELDCGGAYIKVLPVGTDQSSFDGNSRYKYAGTRFRCHAPA